MSPPIGTPVRGVWGACFPEYRGTVVGHAGSGLSLIEWEDWCESPGQHPYKVDQGPNPNGSLVGVWTDEGLRTARLALQQRHKAPADARCSR